VNTERAIDGVLESRKDHGSEKWVVAGDTKAAKAADFIADA
jgi:hypothetical protein